jgi:hypothetical protein
MSNAVKPAKMLKEGRKFRLSLLVPALSLLAIVLVSLRNIGPITVDWNGVSLVAPIESGKRYTEELRFETDRRTAVRAAISGTISIISDRQIEIVGTPVSVSYIGITSMTARDGQLVKRGEAIGQLEPMNSSGQPATLRLRVIP